MPEPLIWIIGLLLGGIIGFVIGRVNPANQAHKSNNVVIPKQQLSISCPSCGSILTEEVNEGRGATIVIGVGATKAYVCNSCGDTWDQKI